MVLVAGVPAELEGDRVLALRRERVECAGASRSGRKQLSGERQDIALAFERDQMPYDERVRGRSAESANSVPSPLISCIGNGNRPEDRQAPCASGPQGAASAESLGVMTSIHI